MKFTQCINRRNTRCFAIFAAVLFFGSLSLTSYDPNSLKFHTTSNISSFSSAVANCFKTPSQFQTVIPELPLGRARHDNQRILQIYDFYFTGSEWESLVKKYDICFSTQTSIERMYWVPSILEKWTGPLSLAIQLISEEEWAIFNMYMIYLTKCHSTFERQVAIHLAFPSNLTSLKVGADIFSEWNRLSTNSSWVSGETCPEAKKHLNYLLDMLPTKDKEKLGYKEVYPQNHMRNIARKGCATYWTYSADVDIIPRNGMADMLQQFYNEHKIQGTLCTKCAYVIPTFELNKTFPFPESKEKVVELFKIGATRQFHKDVYPPAQDATEYDRWTSTKQKEDTVTVSHPVNQTKLEYFEPFYVSPDNIPPFDERFLGYGFTRSSQFKAAIIVEWEFFVLTPLFSIHWGLQNTKTYEVPKKGGVGKSVRKEQTDKNRNIYISFVQELEFKHKLETFYNITPV